MNGYLRWIQEGEAIMKAEEEAEVLQTRLSVRARRRTTALPAGFGIPGEDEEEAEEEVIDEIDDLEPEESWGSKIDRGLEAFRGGS